MEGGTGRVRAMRIRSVDLRSAVVRPPVGRPNNDRSPDQRSSDCGPEVRAPIAAVNAASPDCDGPTGARCLSASRSLSGCAESADREHEGEGVAADLSLADVLVAVDA